MSYWVYLCARRMLMISGAGTTRGMEFSRLNLHIICLSRRGIEEKLGCMGRQARQAVELREHGNPYGVRGSLAKYACSYGGLQIKRCPRRMSERIEICQPHVPVASAVPRIHGGTRCWIVQFQDVHGLLSMRS